MRIAIIGCGFVADFYMQSLPLYPGLELVAVMDRDVQRGRDFAAFHRLDCLVTTIDAVLADPRVEMVLNLTNPDSHFEVSRACLLAGKHVYSEKPLAMSFADAQELTSLADARGLRIASAPCNVLGETAQGTWAALRGQRVGPVKLVYAEMDDGMVHRMPYRKWLSDSGRPWPYKDEFEVGCTLEHAGYYVTWLTAFFGPASSVHAFSAALYPDKGTEVPLERISPDLTVACIQFASGVVARLTCSIVARRNQELQFFGERGILEVETAWDYRAPVRVKRYWNMRRRMLILPSRNVPLPPPPQERNRRRNANPMEFCRGPAEIAASIREGRRSRLPADFCLHNNEIVLAIHNAAANGVPHAMTTSFEAVEPMSWVGRK